MSDSDLDNELLAIAGQAKKKASRGKRRREDDSDEDVSFDAAEEEDEEEEWQDSEEDDEQDAPRGKKRATGKGRVASATKDKKPARGRAQESSDDDDDDLDFEGLEDLIEDDEDRRRLAAMTEAEREMVLFERGEQKRKEQERRRLLQQAGVATDEPARKEDRKKAGKGRGQRKEEPPATRAVRSGREVREEQAKKSAMEELKAARERKARTTEEKSRRRERGSASEEQEAGGDEDEELSEELGGPQARADEEAEISDMDEDEGEYRRPRTREGVEDEEEEEASFEDIKSITVRRHKLEQWVNEPFFEATMVGCMVRLALGEKVGADGVSQPVYLLAQVLDVEERPPGDYKDSGQRWRSPYPFGPTKARTNKWLRVARGFSERGLPLAQVSNQGVSVEEFESWQRACREQRRGLITLAEVREVRERLIKADNYTYTAEDVARVLAAKRAAGRGVHNAALEKARTQRERDAAAEKGDEEEVARLDAVIEELDAAIVRAKTDRRKHSMASINKRNADMNFQNAIQNVSNKVEGAFTAAAKSTTLDPFSRRATRPMVYWNTKRAGEGEEDIDGFADEGTQLPAAGAEEGEGVVSPRAAAAVAAAAAEQRAKLESVVDLSGLDLSVLDAPPSMPQIARKLLGGRWELRSGLRMPAPSAELAAAGKLLTMQDYKRRQGLA